MRKRGLAALVVAGALAVGCSGAATTADPSGNAPSASPPAAGPSPSPTPAASVSASPTPAPGPVPLGRQRPVVVKDDFGGGGVVAGRVTAHRFADHVAPATRPAENGDHWAAVDVTACVDRAVTLAFSGWALFDDAGAVEQSTRIRSAAFPQPVLPADLPAGCRRGWVTFEVADGATLVVFALVQSPVEPPPAWQIGG